MALGVLLWQPCTQQQHAVRLSPTQNQGQEKTASFLMVTTQGLTARAISVTHTCRRLPFSSMKSFPPNTLRKKKHNPSLYCRTSQHTQAQITRETYQDRREVEKYQGYVFSWVQAGVAFLRRKYRRAGLFEKSS